MARPGHGRHIGMPQKFERYSSAKNGGFGKREPSTVRSRAWGPQLCDDAAREGASGAGKRQVGVNFFRISIERRNIP